jgi:CHAT domain-containing protein/tetratricopeptide (TPR) repeat protein
MSKAISQESGLPQITSTDLLALLVQRIRRAILAAGKALCGFAFVLTVYAAPHQEAVTKAPARPPQDRTESFDSSLYEKELAEAWRLSRIGKADEAEKSFREIVQKSAGKDVVSEAEAHLGLATVATRHADLAAGRGECEQALALYNSVHNVRGVARTQEQLGNIAFIAGDNKSARAYYGEALMVYDAEGLLKEKAAMLLFLANATEGYPERIKMDTQALEIARQLGDRRTQGRAHHDIGQWVFRQGDSETAEEHYKAAEAFLDAPDDKMHLARVLLSEGAVQRAHGEMDLSIETYKRALKLAEEVDDKQGQLQIMNALGSSYGDSGEYREAIDVFQRAYELGKNSGSTRVINSLLRNMAEVYVYMGEYQRGAEIVEELNRKTPDPFPYDAQYRYASLASAYEGMGKHEAALAAAKKSVEEVKAHNNGQYLSVPLMLKARTEEKMGNSEAALADVREALKAIEELRAHLVPSDFMKRGFSEKTQQAFAFSVELLEGLNQPAQAIEIAEKARSRAFLDLLATRQEKIGKPKEEGSVAEKKSAPPIPPAKAASAQAQGSRSETQELTQRGGKTAGTPAATAPADPDLPSVVSTESATLKEMQEQARRLHSTILSYWVGSDSAFVWLLDSSDAVHSARIPLKREHLVELVRGVWPLDARSESAAKTDPAGANSHEPAPGRRAAVGFPSRGQTELKANYTQKEHWRELYQLLIEPVEAYLPSQEGSRITIIPHGPLFALPFAGLRDAHGRYFLERYTLEYAPAISVLRFTRGSASHTEGAVPHLLLVADPAGMQKLGLPQLPGSRREAADVARRFPSGEVTMLTGVEAQAGTVRTMAAKSSIIHFATHGILDDTQPFDSYLALADGKLTARDIYGLNLNADLVFLSACRSGMGKVTGDGVLGLTRAFLYAGTRSVVATLWDVADEPTAKLVSSFYKNLGQNPDKAQALRSAQLSVLRQLRAGKMQVATRRGPLTLPENPVFWASFVLIGEP